jgi:hypothetical protein
MKDSSLKFCPIPEDQQPVNEYEQLKDSWFFGWTSGENSRYQQKLAGIWLLMWVITGPIAAASFLPQKHPLLFILSGVCGTTILLALILLRLYLGWFYIRDRLNSEQVSYEESGWYDGRVWQKTPEELTRDRLILSYQVDPIIKRLQQTALFLASLMASSGIIWFCLDAI